MKWSRSAAVLVSAVALAAGCSSSPRSTASPPPPALPVMETAQTPPPPPTRIESIAVREAAPGTVVEVSASKPVVWTSYRSPEGRLVVELPNTLPGTALPGRLAGEGLVEAVEMAEESSGERPLTRLTVTTRTEVEHSLVAEGHTLRVELQAMAGEEESAAFAYEPLPATEQTAPAEGARAAATPPVAGEPSTAALADLGTADSPRQAPPPSSPQASHLEAIEVMPDGTILVAGDGEFAYSTFRLEDPERFILDLEGVVNTAGLSALEVGSPLVRRVRMAQFRPFPDPVSRVVFDLEGTALPVVERTSAGLMVRFAPLSPRPMPEVARMPPPPAPLPAMPEPEPEPEPMMEEPMPAMDEPMMAEPMPAMPEPEPEPEPMMEEPMPAMDEPMMAEVEEPEPEVEVRTTPPEPEPMPPPRVTPPPPRVTPPPPMPTAPPTVAVELTSPPGTSAVRVDIEPTASVSSGDGTTVTSRVFGAQTISGGEQVYVGEPISMSLREADVVETLRSFAAISGLSIVVQPEVSGSVTVELDNIPWDQALQQILKINRLGYELEGTVMRIAPVSVLKEEAQEQQQLAAAKALQVPLRTVMRRLSYASAEEVSALLRGGGLLSQRGDVLVDRRTNTLIIQELPNYVDTVIAIIEEIDTPEPQVMIEARIVETTKRFTRTLGVDWSVSGEASARFGNTTGLVFPNNVAGTGGVNLVTGAQNGFLNLSLGNVLNSFNLDVALQAAENEGLIKILSAPKVAVLNNESANIQSGLQIPVQTIANNTVTVQFINATLSLDVVPHVTAEGTVLMDIEIRKREPQLAFAVVGASNAPIATKEASTRVIVRDGGTTVIGGIYEISSDQGEDRVPGLANIPIIGHLFKNKRRTDENEELLIFITPRVINL